jgi:hypothetical protein
MECDWLRAAVTQARSETGTSTAPLAKSAPREK